MAYHSITFKKGTTQRNTWDDWAMVPTSKPVIAMPSVTTNYIDIPGANGSLDLSEALTGYPVFGDREGEIEFMFLHKGLDTSVGYPAGYDNTEGSGGFSRLITSIMTFLHGQKMDMYLDDYPDWHYTGRFTLDNPTAEEQYTKINIKYRLEPYKYSNAYVKSLWLWDPLKFSAGVNKYTGVTEGSKGTHITTFDNQTFSSNTAVVIEGIDFPASAKVYSTVAGTVKTPNGTVSINVGQNESGLFVVYPGTNTWYFSSSDGSTGKYSIEFQLRSM